MCLSTNAQVVEEEEDTCCPDHHILCSAAAWQLTTDTWLWPHHIYIILYYRCFTIVTTLQQQGNSPGLGLLLLEGLHALLSCFVCLCLLLCLLHRCSVVDLGFCKLDMG